MDRPRLQRPTPREPRTRRSASRGNRQRRPCHGSDLPLTSQSSPRRSAFPHADLTMRDIPRDMGVGMEAGCPAGRCKDGAAPRVWLPLATKGSLALLPALGGKRNGRLWVNTTERSVPCWLPSNSSLKSRSMPRALPSSLSICFYVNFLRCVSVHVEIPPTDMVALPI